MPPPTGIPAGFELDPGRPNPSSDGTVIGFTLPVAADVHLELFDVQGRSVRRLLDGRVEAGPRRITWDLRDAAGHRVAPGIYIYRMSAAGWVGRSKLVVLP